VRYTIPVVEETTPVVVDDTEESSLDTSEDFSIPIECECVRYIRETFGVPIRGNADTIEPNTDVPITGGVVLLNYDGVFHAAYIKAELPNGNLLVEDANYEKCEVTERVIEKDDERIRGFWFSNPNRNVI
jgi:hypothetical protein